MGIGVRPSPGFQPHITSLSSVRCSTSWSRLRFLFCFGSLMDRQICASVRPCQIMGVAGGGGGPLGGAGGGGGGGVGVLLGGGGRFSGAVSAFPGAPRP